MLPKDQEEQVRESIKTPRQTNIRANVKTKKNMKH